MPVLDIIVNSGEGPFLELAFIGILLLVAGMLYITYKSIQTDRHSPDAMTD